MAYTPTTWKSGDVVTSAKLNKLETGVANAGGVFRVLFTDNGSWECEKTFAEVLEAYNAGMRIYAQVSSDQDAFGEMLYTVSESEQYFYGQIIRAEETWANVIDIWFYNYGEQGDYIDVAVYSYTMTPRT